MPEPAAVLAEGCRVLRPRGSIFIVGPNLMGLSPSLAALSVHVWRNRPLRRVLVRDAAMPRHPYGNTLPEVVWTMVTNGFRLGGKLLSPEANPTMRTPDTTPPFFADNDASFVCNPVDVKRMLRREGVRVIRDGKPGRPGFLSMMSGGRGLLGGRTWARSRSAVDLVTRRRVRAEDPGPASRPSSKGLLAHDGQGGIRTHGTQKAHTLSRRTS